MRLTSLTRRVPSRGGFAAPSTVRRPSTRVSFKSRDSLDEDEAATFVTIKTNVKADFGDTVLAVSAPAWDPSTSPALSWSEGNAWEATVAVLASEMSSPLEFKLVLARADGSLVWEDGPNRALALPEAPGRIVAEAAWGVPGDVSVAVLEAEEEEAAAVEAPPPAPTAAAEVVVEAPPAPAPVAAAVVEDDAPAVVEEEPAAEPEPEPVVAAAEAVGEAAAPATPAVALPEPSPLARQILTAATGAATLGFTAVVASALAVDVTEVAAVSGLAALGAAAIGSRNPEAAAKLKEIGGASAGALGGLAAGAEAALRSAGLKSFKEQEEGGDGDE